MRDTLSPTSNDPDSVAGVSGYSDAIYYLPALWPCSTEPSGHSERFSGPLPLMWKHVRLSQCSRIASRSDLGRCLHCACRPQSKCAGACASANIAPNQPGAKACRMAWPPSGGLCAGPRYHRCLDILHSLGLSSLARHRACRHVHWRFRNAV
jgi:hypothetical protein